MARSRFPRPISGRMFTSILQEPIDKIPPVAVALLVDGEPEVTRQAVYKMADDHEACQVAERLSALAEHYKVNPLRRQWALELLLAVCKDFIVGFNYSTEIGPTPTKAGRRKAKTKFPQFEFWHQVTLLRSTKGIELSDACRHLSRQRGKAWSGHTVRALRERFNRFEKSLHSRHDDPVFRQMMELAKAANTKVPQE